MILSFLILFGFGCSTTNETVEDVVVEDVVIVDDTIDLEESIEPEEEEIDSGQIYVQFVLNVHDWVYPEKSIETLNRVIDMHEQYKLPVEMHLTDTVTQNYVEQAPELMERLRTSSM